MPVSDFNPSEKLQKLLGEEIDTNKLISEYMELFNTYYNPQYYIKNTKKKWANFWRRSMEVNKRRFGIISLTGAVGFSLPLLQF